MLERIGAISKVAPAAHLVLVDLLGEALGDAVANPLTHALRMPQRAKGHQPEQQRSDKGHAFHGTEISSGPC